MTAQEHQYYTTHLDKQFDAIPHLQAYPKMRPFVGSKYGNNGTKILLIGESHYLPKDSTVHLDAEQWYQGKQADLGKEEELKWINTRGILNKKDGRWTKKGHTIYRNIEQALVEAGLPKTSNTFQFVAFMNGFQRPAKERNSIEVHKKDIEVSIGTVKSVIDILKPDHVVFVSQKAKHYLGKHLNTPYHNVPHPACSWWNRPSKNKGTGKEQFIKLIASFQNLKEASDEL